MTKTNLFISFDRENDRKNGDAEESARRETRRRTLEETVQRVGPVIRETFVEYFRSQGLSTVDYTGDEQVAIFKEETGSKEHTWKVSSWKKTGTHTEYRSDGAHQLDEHTGYTITISVIVTPENVPLLHFGEYTTSKLVGRKPITASNFSMEVPSRLKELLRDKTGIKPAETAEYFKAKDH